MLRINVSPAQFRLISVGCFVMSTIHIRRALSTYRQWRQDSMTTRRIKGRLLSTTSKVDSSATSSVIDSSAQRKKSALYTKTGDKGMSSVSLTQHIHFTLFCTNLHTIES